MDTIPEADTVNGLNQIERDHEGFLLFPDAWTPEIAIELAVESNQLLTDNHWQIIHYIRDYFEEMERVPEARSVLKHMKSLWGTGYGTRRYLYELFPIGYGQSACKIAGMRLPRKLMLDV